MYTCTQLHDRRIPGQQPVSGNIWRARAVVFSNLKVRSHRKRCALSCGALLCRTPSCGTLRRFCGNMTHELSWHRTTKSQLSRVKSKSYTWNRQICSQQQHYCHKRHRCLPIFAPPPTASRCRRRALCLTDVIFFFLLLNVAPLIRQWLDGSQRGLLR